VAHAQQPAMPMIGFLSGTSLADWTHFVTAFGQGLQEEGFIESQNVRIEYRWANGAYERLPDLAAELVNLRVNVIAAFGTAAARAAKTASVSAASPIPVVFSMGSDPVAEGLIASLNRPGANVTGVTSIGGALATKRLALLRAFLPEDATIAILINPSNPLSEAEKREFESASRTIGRQLEVLTASSEPEIDSAFAMLKQRHISAMIIAVDTFYYGRMRQISALASRYEVPTIGPLREFAEDGGLMSYGTSIYDVVRHAGVYTGKVLAGVQPADLPVQQPTKFELVINLKTAKTLGLTVPNTILVTADEMIE
jgi:putative ABC transport system substrate-binding protein